MPTATATQVDQRVTLTFASKGNSRTRWIEMTYPVDAPPTALLDALAEIGFKEQDGMVALPPYQAHTWDRSLPLGQQYVDLGYRETEVHLTKSGTDLFGGWTAEEQRTNMNQARAIMRRFGFTRVPVWKKSISDML